MQFAAGRFFEDESDVSDSVTFLNMMPPEGEARQDALESVIASAGIDTGRVERLGAVIAETPSLAAELVTVASRSENDWSMCSALAAAEVAAHTIKLATGEDDPRLSTLRDVGRQGQAALGIPKHIDTTSTAYGALEQLGESADEISFTDALTYAGTVFHGYNQFNGAYKSVES